MTHEQGALYYPAPRRSPTRTPVPVLIRVPNLARPASRHAGRPAMKRRRRLRKEVRVVGSLLLLLVPFSAAGLLLQVGASPAETGCADADRPAYAAREAPPAVSISFPIIEAEVPCEAAAPVKFPDYVLPDDGAEEASHAGN